MIKNRDFRSISLYLANDTRYGIVVKNRLEEHSVERIYLR